MRRLPLDSGPTLSPFPPRYGDDDSDGAEVWDKQYCAQIQDEALPTINGNRDLSPHKYTNINFG